MRIGFFADSYLPARHGVQASIDSFKSGLEKLGHQVFIYTAEIPGYKDTSPNIFRFRAPLRIIKKPHMRLALPSVRGTKWSEILDHQLDIVHAHSPFSMGLIGRAIAKRKKIPMIYTHHTHYPEYAKAYFRESMILPYFSEKLTAWFSNQATAVIAPSEKVRGWLKDYGIRSPMYVLGTGIDLKRFSKNKKTDLSGALLRHKLGIKESDRVWLSLGRVSKEKNIDLLISAFKEAITMREDMRFVIAGDGPYLDYLKNHCKKIGLSDHVIFAGFIDENEKPDYYHAADIFVFASHTDTQGIVVLEAMACGLPIVASSDETLDGIVSNNKNGYLVSPDDPRVFAERAVALIKDKKVHNNLSKQSIAIAKDFGEDAVTLKLLSIYRSVL